MTPQVTPARSATCLAVAAANPSSMMQRTVSSMILARVSSPRLRGAVVRLVGPAGDRAAGLGQWTLLTL
ncbi:hypothetical protein O972_21970 [Mycobacterium avium subsp. avium 10-9275]|nr:hypothetical protein O972_21970 [Mycobacterium avium subsp. avium 10-9275]